MEQVVPAANQTENNNNNAGGAMSAEDMQLKMQEQQRQIEALRAEKEQAAAEAARAREAAEAARARETARRAEEEADSEFGMSLNGDFRGPSFHGTPSIGTNVFAAEPAFNYTGNLNLSRPNLTRQDESTPKDTSVLRGNDSSDSEYSECEYA